MKRFTPQQKLEIIRAYLLSPVSVYAICREYKISKVTFYKWLALYRRSRKNRIDALTSKVRKGKLHPKSLDYKQRLAILGLVHIHPEYSTHKIAEVLGMGNFGIQTFLYKVGLNKYEARLTFSLRPFWKRQNAQSRQGMMDLYKQGWSVADICRHFNVSKPIFYKWQRRFDAAHEGEKRQALADRNVRGPEHYKYLDDGKKQQIIDLVKTNPEFSVHKIHRHLAGLAGHYTVQNVLKREGLSTYENRLNFAQRYARQPEIQTAPLYIPDIPLYKLRHLIAHFATVPKLLVTHPKLGLSRAFVYLSTLVLLILWIRLLFTTPYATPVGLFFASIALFFGLFFFIYSMKYYITVLLVLKLAQGGGANAGQGRGLGRLGLLGRLGEKLLRLKHKAEDRVNPLTLNLDKISLKSFPFVSIHVALYNEKRVVERLIRACEAQEYYEGTSTTSSQGTTSTTGSVQEALNTRDTPAAYEVIIVDDSTDETTDIAKQMLSGDGRILDRTLLDEEMEIYVSSPPVGSQLPVIKLIHRFSRSGFKGGALQRALENTNPKAEYISVFDADFVPYPDTIEQFVKTFQELNANNDANVNTANVSEYSHKLASQNSLTNSHSNIAAVQGYQWHVLNKSQTWITRGVRTEYAGSYVIERAGEEIYGGLKQIAGSVYAIRADILRQFGWGTSITEDFELTLRLYEAGYKVAFTPYIQAPAEAVSTIKRLVRQRMRWAEGASHNVKIMLPRMLWGRWETPSSVIARNEMTKQSDEEIATLAALARNDNESRDGDDRVPAINDTGSRLAESGHDPGSSGRVWVPSGLTKTEKLEFAYLAPYYLQAAFFVVGTFSWFISEAILGSRLPFWTAALGWSLVFTNILALPLMNIVGLFLEESDERDYIGVLSFIVLSYIVVPFQAYAAIKGFLETEEGPWFRTPKTGIVTDTFGRSRFSKFFGDLLGKGVGATRTDHDPVSSSSDTGSEMPEMLPNFALAFRPINAGNFRVRPRHARYAGNLALGLVIAITVSMSMIAPFVPKTYVNAQQPAIKTLAAVPDSSSVNSVHEKNPENEEEIIKNATSEEITKQRLISQTLKNGTNIEYIFDKEPVVRIKIDGREIEFETETIGGRRVNPTIARIFGNKEVVYENIVEGVDLKYKVNESLITEEFIIHDRETAEMLGGKIEQNIRTVDVKVVSPNPGAFGFYSSEGKELFQLSAPFAKDNNGLITNDLSLSLDQPFDFAGGYRLTKTIGESARNWLSDSTRSFPVIIDPTVIVTGGVDDSETTYGGLQRKLAFVNSNWYAFYNCDANPCTSTESKNKVYYQKSSNGTSWGGYVDMDSSDTDNFSPSISVSGNTIFVAWLDGSLDAIEIKTINTASSDALTGLCASGDQGTIDTTTFMVTVAAVSTEDAVVAFSDTSTDTEVDLFYAIENFGSPCTPIYADIEPGNVDFGSGITASDRPVVIPLSSKKVGMVFQDGVNLMYSEFDTDALDWTKNKLIIGSGVTDNVYSVTTDQAASPTVWILTANISDATDTNFFTCCSADIAETSVDSDTGGNDQDIYPADMFCPTEANCKIVYTDDTDTATPNLKFVDCNDATCSAPTITTIDSDIGAATDNASPSIFCVDDGDAVVSDNCKIFYGDDMDTTAPLGQFVDCTNDEDCSTNTITNVDADLGDSTSSLYDSIYCPSDGNCKVTYVDEGIADFFFVDCPDATCTSTGRVITQIDSNCGDCHSDIYCVASDNCKVVYPDEGAASDDIIFIDCTADEDCSTRTATTIDADAGSTDENLPVAIDCVGGDTDCKFIYADGTANDLFFVNCSNAVCSTQDAGSPNSFDANGGTTAALAGRPSAAMDCFSATDCKFLYVGDLTSSGENLYFIDCDDSGNSNCTSGSALELPGPRFQGSLQCLTSANCKIAYLDGNSNSNPVLIFADCDVTNCFPSSVDDTDPWQATGSNIETVSLTYDSTNSDLYASIIQDASDQAYYKSSDATSISWSGQTSWDFTAGALNEISSPERGAGAAQVGVVLNRTDANGNFEFASVPETTIYLALLAPFLYRMFGKRRCRGRRVLRC